ncbi:MAG TPA: RIO1 family regulatory kinase/ATPase [Candidatus Bathyarchaeia archaeon]|nr:RIO1 family regulatory kinase/ATPase [Candidatus Bathyarchaeia archaeon]
MKTPLIVPIENLKEEPYASVLCYPRVSETELQNRLGELQKLGVKAVEFAGKTSAFNLPVLGKGYVGVVIIAHLDGQRAALKVRRVDADRLGLQHEAQMLAKANSVNVGPKLMSVSTNFLLMQFIGGGLLPAWLETHKEKEHVRSVLSEVLEQCWRLDAIGLDHGELSHAPKHLIVAKDEQPFIVDFETASVNRKPANVTSICQFLFTSSGAVTRMVAETLGEKSAEEIVSVLRIYKNHRTRENFDQVLQTCLP